MQQAFYNLHWLNLKAAIILRNCLHMKLGPRAQLQNLGRRELILTHLKFENLKNRLHTEPNHAQDQYIMS